MAGPGGIQGGWRNLRHFKRIYGNLRELARSMGIKRIGRIADSAGGIDRIQDSEENWRNFKRIYSNSDNLRELGKI